jgi:hypothetical protein
MLNWLIEEKGIAPHIPVFNKSKRDDGTFSRGDFRYDPTRDVYHCPAGKNRGARNRLPNNVCFPSGLPNRDTEVG